MVVLGMVPCPIDRREAFEKSDPHRATGGTMRTAEYMHMINAPAYYPSSWAAAATRRLNP